jgi:hypothetical protein
MFGFRGQQNRVNGGVMVKTQPQLEKDVNAALKLILSEMEMLAALPPEIASEPYAFEERRRKVVRRIWDLYKDILNYGNPGRTIQ